jgi:hypothetical protein
MSWESPGTGFQIDGMGELNSAETFKLEVATKAPFGDTKERDRL